MILTQAAHNDSNLDDSDFIPSVFEVRTGYKVGSCAYTEYSSQILNASADKLLLKLLDQYGNITASIHYKIPTKNKEISECNQLTIQYRCLQLNTKFK